MSARSALCWLLAAGGSLNPCRFLLPGVVPGSLWGSLLLPAPHRDSLQPPQAVLGMAEGAHRPAPSSLGPEAWAWINSPKPIFQGSRSRHPLLAFWFNQEPGRQGVAGPNEQGVPPGVVRSGVAAVGRSPPTADGRAGLHNTHLC